MTLINPTAFEINLIPVPATATTCLDRRLSEVAIPTSTYVIKDFNEILPRMTGVIDEIADVLCLDRDVVELMLIHFNWNKDRLMDSYSDNHERTAEACGIDLYDSQVVQGRLAALQRAMKPAPEEVQAAPAGTEDDTSSGDDVAMVCDICCCDFDLSKGEGFGLCCNHFYCRGCYGQYVNTEIDSKGMLAVKTRCMAYKCSQVLPRTFIEMLCSEVNLEKFRTYNVRNFVSFSRNLKYCPAPGCTKIAIGSGVHVSHVTKVCAPSESLPLIMILSLMAIACIVVTFMIVDPLQKVRCDCGNLFCFHCNKEAHVPCSCNEWLVWCEKIGSGDSVTAKWITVNTKQCKKCQWNIEKNGGCNHMTCQRCGHQFCWMCGGC